MGKGRRQPTSQDRFLPAVGLLTVVPTVAGSLRALTP
jgi:hypothetical protein